MYSAWGCSMPDLITLFGAGGRLHTAVGTVLARSATVRQLDSGIQPVDVDGSASVVAVSESADLPGAAMLRKACVTAGVSWLTVSVEYDRALVGPVSAAGLPGCDTCARRRRRAARQRAHDHVTIREHNLDLDRTGSPLLSGPAVDLVAELAGADLAGPRQPRTFAAVDLRSLAVRRHSFLPDPTCPDCGGLPEDGPQEARIVLRSRPKPDPGTFRMWDLTGAGADLLTTYVDQTAGIVRAVRTEYSGSFVRAMAPLSSLTDNESQHGWGRALNARTARLTAVLESLERLGGGQPRGRRTTVRGSYRELGAWALDPRSLGLYPDEWYDRPGFPFARFHEDLELSWVWGFSFGRDEPVLVPEGHAYYSLPAPAGARLAYEISNGCAVGSTLEEAILHGLLEVAERDAFLMTWYARMSVPQLDLRSARDRNIPLMAESLSERTGYRISVFSTTLEQGIPCFWGMASDRLGEPERARAVCAAGSALVADKGVVCVLHELAHLLDNVRLFDTRKRERAARMVADPALVKAMGDHAMVYFHDAAFDRFDFLLSQPEVRTFDDLADSWLWPWSTDLRDDLRELLARYLDRGLDVIVVDQTAPEHRAGGLSCVKVLVPGTLPMTFGHDRRRVHGLPRLYTVPAELGYRDRVLTPATVSCHPHPFP